MQIVSAQEKAFGDYGPERFGWELTDIMPLERAAVRGALGLFEVPDALIPPEQR